MVTYKKKNKIRQFVADFSIELDRLQERTVLAAETQNYPMLKFSSGVSEAEDGGRRRSSLAKPPVRLPAEASPEASCR